MTKSIPRIGRCAHLFMMSCLLLISNAQADPPIRFMGVTATDSYKTLHKQLFHSAEKRGYNGKQNNDNVAYWGEFADLKVFGASVSHAMLFTSDVGGITSRRLSIWLYSAVDFDGHVGELSRTNGEPNEITESLGNQASPIASWSTAGDGIAYELVFEGGIADEEGAAIHLKAHYASKKN